MSKASFLVYLNQSRKNCCIQLLFSCHVMAYHQRFEFELLHTHIFTKIFELSDIASTYSTKHYILSHNERYFHHIYRYISSGPDFEQESSKDLNCRPAFLFLSFLGVCPIGDDVQGDIHISYLRAT